MRTDLVSLVLSGGLFALGLGTLAAQVPEHRRLPAAVEAALEPVHGGRGMAAWFGDFARDEDRQPWREEEWRRREKQGLAKAMAAAAVCELWSDDADVAYGAACHVPEHALDLADIDRYVASVRPHLFDEDPRFDWDTFRHVLSPEQVADVLRARPDPDSAHRQIFIADLHRSFRAEHIPLLCARVADPDPVVRKDAFQNLLNLLRYGGGSTPLVLDTLLGWPGDEAFEFGDYEDPATWPAYAPRSVELSTSRAGSCSPGLAALLHRWLVELRNEPAHGALGPWLLQQAEAQTFSGDADAELIATLVTDGASPGPWIGVRAAVRCPDVRTPLVQEALRAFAGSTEDDVARALAQLALGQIEELRDRCLDDAAAATVLLERGDPVAFRRLTSAALQEDEAAGLDAMEFLLDVLEDALFEPVLLPPRVEARLGEMAEGALGSLDARRLAAMLERCPGARRRALVVRLLGQIEAEDATQELLALFEVTDEAALRARLASWQASGELPEDAQEALQKLTVGEAPAPDLEALRRETMRPGANVQEALVALAAARDPGARRAMAEVRRRHLYGWVDSYSSVELAEGFDLGLAPYWIDELETICCRRNGAAEVVEGLIGVDAFDYPEWGLRSQGAAVRAFFERHRDRLRLSRVLGRYVVGPTG
jgi:hypothetical protein